MKIWLFGAAIAAVLSFLFSGTDGSYLLVKVSDQVVDVPVAEKATAQSKPRKAGMRSLDFPSLAIEEECKTEECVCGQLRCGRQPCCEEYLKTPEGQKKLEELECRRGLVKACERAKNGTTYLERHPCCLKHKAKSNAARTLGPAENLKESGGKCDAEKCVCRSIRCGRQPCCQAYYGTKEGLKRIAGLHCLRSRTKERIYRKLCKRAAAKHHACCFKLKLEEKRSKEVPTA